MGDDRCVNCGERSASGVVDAYGRFWCEDCVIWILAETEPRYRPKARYG